MKRSYALKGAAVLGAAGLALAACSGGGGGGGTDDKSDEPAPKPDETSAAPAADCVADHLIYGSLLPATGSLAFLGPPEFAGVELAVKEINEAGGVNDKDVEYIEGDSGDTSQNVAGPTIDSHLQKNVNVVVGAASSAVSLMVIDKVVGEGVVMISPANTSPEFTERSIDGRNKGLYFRTAPPDGLQGTVLAQVAINDGIQNASILALQDSYGTGLANVFQSAFAAQGGNVSDAIFYDPKAASYEAEVQQVKSENPDAIVLIGFDETKKLLSELMKQGLGPDKVQLYLVDGNLSNSLGENLEPGAMKGVKGTQPGADTEGFKDALFSINPDLEDFNYGPEAYDATNITALAAQVAGCADGTAIAAHISEVTALGNEECDSFASCKALLDEGKAISYTGPSGAVGLDENGDPSRATIGVYEFGDDNVFEAVDFVVGDVPPFEAAE